MTYHPLNRDSVRLARFHLDLLKLLLRDLDDLTARIQQRGHISSDEVAALGRTLDDSERRLHNVCELLSAALGPPRNAQPPTLDSDLSEQVQDELAQLAAVLDVLGGTETEVTP